MCSVVGCDSSRRSAQRFKLPEDPERRLVWVQFLFEVNGQRLKESSWTDITICTEHFTHDCFENVTPAAGTVQLKPNVVPSVCIKSEPEGPPDSPQAVEPVQTTHIAYQCDNVDACDSPTSHSEESEHTPTGSQASPESSGVSVSYSSDASNVAAPGFDRVPQKLMTGLNREKAALLQKRGKFVVNESCLLQLFRRKCPLCGCKLQMEKVTYGALVVFNQWCLRCEYRYQWKSQVNASVPTAEFQHLRGGSGFTSETQQEVATEDDPSTKAFSQIVMLSDEDSDPPDEDEEGDDGGVSSDEEWHPSEGFLLTEELAEESEEETEDEGEEEEQEFDSLGGLKINELCTECGRFFDVLKPHACEHKIKPYSCNICGKRCVTEMSLKIHSKIHDETYEHPCKYCHVTFKTRVDKCKHEQTHQDSKDPYKCPDCPKTFTTSKERSIHLANHRAPKEFKCGVCGIEFKDVHHLRRHSVVHTGLKPYKCSVCKRGFNQTSHLKSHMRLHTGERPYKCQHCDHSFNHNVSLKSHVQRYHSSSAGCERKKGKRKERASGSKGTDSEFDSAEGQDTEEEVMETRTDVPKSKRRSTGRPRGRPKRNAAGGLVLAGRGGGRRSNTKSAKSKAQKLKRTGSSDEESEDEQSSSDASFDEEEEEEKEEKEAPRKSAGRSRGRPKNDSDTGFVPEEETKKKRYSSQCSGESSGKRRGRKI
ncbi:RE1-silencing transcription factor-like [Chelmon rostratus]|uniref:RE1-silencing transcription factor-like n=1 Tax=Chelmon rostratus TaxID=109905 RepID=UPI001BE7BD5D|nr:RE1-silencing transcription factor-like [Chelmon rostratus]